ncbi:hypothetical protein VNO80_18760 [Phaseolus coccineus]|uniref:Uncharacterized protein n=1 Tax=Phaseolus coccineus TaxID=3886 RepID=A0AAN9QWQ8_PHACN
MVASRFGEGTARRNDTHCCDDAIFRWEWGCEENDTVKMETLRGYNGAILCLLHMAGLLVSSAAMAAVT